MSLPRCSRCKSAVNPSRFKRCIGCGADLSQTSLASPRRRVRPGDPGEQGLRDGRSAKWFLAVFGILGLVSLVRSLTSGLDWGILTVLGATHALIGLWVCFGVFTRRSRLQPIGRAGAPSAGTSTAPSCMQVIGYAVLSLLALIFGLILLVSLVCSAM